MSTPHHLDLEPLLIARLKAKVPTALDVLSAVDLAAVEDQALRTPALHIYYLGDAFDGRAVQGVDLEVEQTWGVVVVVRHQRGPAAQRSQAGELMTAVIGALQGWEPSPNHGRFQRVPAPAPLYGDGGMLFLPLYFSSRVLTSGTES